MLLHEPTAERKPSLLPEVVRAAATDSPSTHLGEGLDDTFLKTEWRPERSKH